MACVGGDGGAGDDGWAVAVANGTAIGLRAMEWNGRCGRMAPRARCDARWLTVGTVVVVAKAKSIANGWVEARKRVILETHIDIGSI